MLFRSLGENASFECDAVLPRPPGQTFETVVLVEVYPVLNDGASNTKTPTKAFGPRSGLHIAIDNPTFIVKGILRHKKTPDVGVSNYRGSVHSAPFFMRRVHQSAPLLFVVPDKSGTVRYAHGITHPGLVRARACLVRKS